MGLLPGLGLQKEVPGRCPAQAAGTVSGLELEHCWGVLVGPVERVHLGQRGSGTDFGDLVWGCGRLASCTQSQDWTVQGWGWNRLGA